MTKELRIVRAVFYELSKRKGFDDLIEQLDDDGEVREELESVLVAVVRKELQAE